MGWSAAGNRTLAMGRRSDTSRTEIQAWKDQGIGKASKIRP